MARGPKLPLLCDPIAQKVKWNATLTHCTLEGYAISSGYVKYKDCGSTIGCTNELP